MNCIDCNKKGPWFRATSKGWIYSNSSAVWHCPDCLAARELSLNKSELSSNQATIQMPNMKEPVMPSTTDKVAVLNSMKNDEMELYKETNPDFEITLKKFIKYMQDPDSDIRLEARRLLSRWPAALRRMSVIYKDTTDPRLASIIGRVFGQIYSEPLVPADVCLRMYGLPIALIECMCVHCGKSNKGIASPPRGETVPYFGQKENKGATVVPVFCDSCGHDFFVAWEQKL